MSRYYAVLRSFTTKRSYVIAEVVREASETDLDDDRDASLASQLLGSSGRIMTVEDLESSSDGRRALRLWRGGNDGAFDRETLRENEPEIDEEPDPARDVTGPQRHLHVVD